jgi:ribokinase
MNSSIVVVGSLNMDFVVSVRHLPAPGETVLGHGFQMVPGGKGANQACAAGKLAGDSTRVRMVGRVGQDVFGDHLKASLSAAGVDVSFVHASRGQPTGVALIAVDAAGQNSIVVASGANSDLAAADVEAMRRILRGATVALFQLENPLETVLGALRIAREENLTTILDPAPAQPLSDELLGLVDILTPNEAEALGLIGQEVRRLAPGEAGEIAHELRKRGPRTVIIKLGDQGCFADEGETAAHFPGYRVDAVDTTAAGDTFNAGLAVALAEGCSLAGAIQFANAAAAISVTRMGAQASAPARAEALALLSSKG